MPGIGKEHVARSGLLGRRRVVEAGTQVKIVRPLEGERDIHCKIDVIGPRS
ncbi:MAG: hypothetical protein PHR30_09405 [Gallionellaceae bacterium]|nr:hypothetical protein [Gallionellaceae bacterium]MDD5365543.1 hypothetical protein [Gallionellaceae bacterium]